MIDLPARFWTYIDKNGPYGCWLWMAYRNHDGYGIFGNSQRKRPTDIAHRLAYLALVGDIPEALVLDHLCCNPACCNPAHLEPVLQGENALRSPNNFILRGLATTRCPRGHDYSAENTAFDKKGKRYCRICNRIKSRERNRRKIGYYERHPHESPNVAEFVGLLTHCKRGHEFIPENTGIYGGERYCRTCHRSSHQDWMRRQRVHAQA